MHKIVAYIKNNFNVRVMECRFKCQRCFYQTDVKQNLMKHLQRKIKCEPVSPEKDIDVLILLEELGSKAQNDKSFCCPQCSKCFNNKSNMYRHHKNCKSGSKHVDVNYLNKKIDILQTEVDRLKGHTIINQQNNIYQQNIQINVNNFNQLKDFGNESLSHIPDTFLTKCLLDMNKGLEQLLHEIHFSESAPENHNVRLRSKKQNMLEVYKDGSWSCSDKNNTLDQMIKRGYKVLFAHFINKKNNDNHIKENTDTLTSWFIDLSGQKGECYYKLRRDIYVLILNNTFYVLGKA